MVKLSITVRRGSRLRCVASRRRRSAATPFTVGTGRGRAHRRRAPTAAARSSGASRRAAATPAKIGYCHIPPAAAPATRRRSSTSRPRPGRSRRSTRSTVTIHRAARTGAPDLRRLHRPAATAAPSTTSTRGARRPTATTWAPDPRSCSARRRRPQGIQPDGAWIGDTNTFVSPGEGTETLVFQTPRRGRHALPGRQRGLRLHAEHGPASRPSAASCRRSSRPPATSARSSTPSSRAGHQRRDHRRPAQVDDVQELIGARARQRRAAPHDRARPTRYLTYRRIGPGRQPDPDAALTARAAEDFSTLDAAPGRRPDRQQRRRAGLRPGLRPAASTSSGRAATTPGGCATRAPTTR